MTHPCLATARLCSAMWVGAAFLFVATSVTEQVQPSFSGDVKDRLALIRFPWFYGVGGTLLATAAGASLFASRRGRRVSVAACLLTGALTVMAADYAFVYRPMRELLVPAGGRGPEFERLHRFSEWANGAGLALSAAAAVILSGVREPQLRDEPPRLHS